jgi:heme/copper-type cytochrome/quinol oxidase subunit 2
MTEPLEIQNSNIGVPPHDIKKGHIVSLWAFAIITILIIVTLAICALWCRRQLKKYLIERKEKENIENDKNQAEKALLETNGDPDKQEDF